MTTKAVGLETIIDNEAVLVRELRLPSGTVGPVTIGYENALVVGMEDGTGMVVVDDGVRPRYLPVARGRVDWLGCGRIEVRPGGDRFGRALLVDVRKLPAAAAGLSRTFGDRLLYEQGDICVYEEIIGPSQVRPMHHHGPRLVLCLSDIDLRNTLPGGEKVEVKRTAGAVTWNPQVVTHEVFNVGAEPFWCVCVERR